MTQTKPVCTLCGEPRPTDPLRDTLIKIARGRDDCGRPYGGNAARDMARDVLYDLKIDWGRTTR